MFLIIGDSISTTPYLSLPGAPSYPELLNRIGYPTVSVAASGRGYRDFVTEAFFRRVRSHQPDGVLINLGINDITGGGGSTLQQMQDRATLLIAMTDEYRASIGKTRHATNVATITPFGFTGVSEELRKDFNDFLHAFVGINVIDLANTIDPEETGLWPDHMNGPDFIHPNALGQIELAKAVLFGAVGLHR